MGMSIGFAFRNHIGARARQPNHTKPRKIFHLLPLCVCVCVCVCWFARLPLETYKHILWKTLGLLQITQQIKDFVSQKTFHREREQKGGKERNRNNIALSAKNHWSMCITLSFDIINTFFRSGKLITFIFLFGFAPFRVQCKWFRGWLTNESLEHGW